MRFSTFVSALFCVSTVLATNLHQHVVKRHSTDICAPIELKLDLGHHVSVNVEACVCLSTLDIFIAENLQLKAASKKFGVRQLKEDLVAQINSHQNKKKCTYPPHGKPSPAAKCSSRSDPCGFTCNDGFTANVHKRTCDCARPNIIYNGRCIPKPGRPGHPQPSGIHHN